MATPTSGEISIGDIRTAFGILGTGRLSNDYGVSVLGQSTNQQTKISDFYGYDGIFIEDPLANGERLSNLTDEISEPSDASTGFQLTTSFDIVVEDIVTGSKWGSPSSTLDNTKYECYLETDSLVINGGVAIGSYDQWLSLDTNRTWSVIAIGTNIGNSVDFSGTLKIRAIGMSSDVFSTTVNMNAIVRRS